MGTCTKPALWQAVIEISDKTNDTFAQYNIDLTHIHTYNYSYSNINGIHSKFKNVRKLKNVPSSEETYLPFGWAMSRPRDLVAIVTSGILRLSYLPKLRVNPIYKNFTFSFPFFNKFTGFTRSAMYPPLSTNLSDLRDLSCTHRFQKRMFF